MTGDAWVVEKFSTEGTAFQGALALAALNNTSPLHRGLLQAARCKRHLRFTKSEGLAAVAQRTGCSAAQEAVVFVCAALTLVAIYQPQEPPSVGVVTHCWQQWPQRSGQSKERRDSATGEVGQGRLKVAELGPRRPTTTKPGASRTEVKQR